LLWQRGADSLNPEPWQPGQLNFSLACQILSGTTLGVASVTQWLGLGFKVEIRIKEVKINFTKLTLVE